MRTVSARWLWISLLLAAGALFAGETLEPAPVGYWEIRNAEGILMLLINADGTGDLNRQPLLWTYVRGILTITQGEKTTPYEASFTPETLTLSGGDLRHAITLTFTSGGKIRDERMVGAWRAEDGAIVEFQPAGIGVNRRGPFRYSAMDGDLSYGDASIALVLRYRVEGDRLELSAGGASASYTRVTAAGKNLDPEGTKKTKPRVVVNGAPLTEKQLRILEEKDHLRVLEGSYWYDRKCGGWGMEAGPTLGYVPAELDLGGPLRADASGGGTGFFVNGRALHPLDVERLVEVVKIPPGHYWLDAKGIMGFEDNPTPFANVAGRARQAQFDAGGRYRNPSDITGVRRNDWRKSFVMGSFRQIIAGD